MKKYTMLSGSFDYLYWLPYLSMMKYKGNKTTPHEVFREVMK